MAIAEVFHIPPWDQGRLTLADLVAAIDTIDGRNAAAEKAEQEARRRRG